MALRIGRQKPKKKAAQQPRPARRQGSRLSRIAFTILVTLAVLALAFFLVVRDADNTSIAENMVGSVFSPISNAVSSATGYVRDVIDGAKSYFQMSQDLVITKQEVETLKLQLSVYEEDARENQRLKELIDARDAQEELDPLYARVSARSTGVWLDTFTINRGTNDGVAVNMPVVTGGGLAGRVPRPARSEHSIIQ